MIGGGIANEKASRNKHHGICNGSEDAGRSDAKKYGDDRLEDVGI